MRSDVLTIFSALEFRINRIILYQYFDWDDPNFALEVLHDENFSFALRRNILEKILRKRGRYEQKKFQNFHDLSKIRNLFAHMTLPFITEYMPIFTKAKRRVRFPHPKYPEQDVDYRKEYEEFKKKSDEAIFYLDLILDKVKK